MICKWRKHSVEKEKLNNKIKLIEEIEMKKNKKNKGIEMT